MNNGLKIAEEKTLEQAFGVLPIDRSVIQNREVGEMPTSHKWGTPELRAGVNVQPTKGGKLVKIQTLFTRKKPINNRYSSNGTPEK